MSNFPKQFSILPLHLFTNTLPASYPLLFQQACSQHPIPTCFYSTLSETYPYLFLQYSTLPVSYSYLFLQARCQHPTPSVSTSTLPASYPYLFPQARCQHPTPPCFHKHTASILLHSVSKNTLPASNLFPVRTCCQHLTPTYRNSILCVPLRDF